jgi:hypothetical protein
LIFPEIGVVERGDKSGTSSARVTLIPTGERDNPSSSFGYMTWAAVKT